MWRALFSAGFRPLFRRRFRLLHSRHVASAGDIFGLENAGTRLTPFQAGVLAATRLVPRGCVTTYGRISRHLGTGSALAVGQALKRNPFAPMVPCHRVIAADLRPGGFAGERTGRAISRKLALLAAEGVRFAGGRLADPERLWEFPGLSPDRP
ncbi:MAG: MGMT family protein [Kiritimatiellaeota bacterium]|nr:MGMT family protein [Kiritimatiellota bacterium]